MDLDDLYSVQEELKKKIQATNQLIESRSRSNSVRSASNGKNHNASADKGFLSAQKLNEKLQFKNPKNVDMGESKSRSPKSNLKGETTPEQDIS